jgi:hypothetical protein
MTNKRKREKERKLSIFIFSYANFYSHGLLLTDIFKSKKYNIIE